ncbi:MAG: crotonase/enoyl-CoA hydratase family protein [Hyphomicrobiaceae bacterium]|nr:crotonase/enoyl-CoA hydratase family protein [Hyphomicrobiaceae bacterium]
MSFKTITLDVDAGVAMLTLNRPDKLNAFNREMMHELIAAFDEVDERDEIRAVIVTGAGRGFCAGADLSAGADTFDYKARGMAETGLGDAHRDGGGRVTLRMFDCLKPVIGAINGPAVGIGATMLLPMDIRLASDTARFGFVFTRRGIIMEACSSYFLPRIVGVSQALEWTMTGRVFSADEALRGGLVRSVHAGADLLPAARTLAREIADNTAPVAVALNRRLIWSMLGASHPMDAHNVDSRLIYQRGSSADTKEGVMSFLEKRPAQFPNKVSGDMPPVFPWEKKRQFE